MIRLQSTNLKTFGKTLDYIAKDLEQTSKPLEGNVCLTCLIPDNISITSLTSLITESKLHA
jgi:hypothetical protein